MKEDKAAIAAELFRGKDKLNCVQAVLKAFQVEYGVSDDDIAVGAKLGGGKAEGGLCGALHAVRMLLKVSDLPEDIASEFKNQAGSLKCKEIRKLNQLPCRDCVALAAELLEKRLAR